MEKIYERLIQAVDLDNLYLHSINSKRYYPDPFRGNVDVDIQTGQRLEYYKDDFFAALAMFYINSGINMNCHHSRLFYINKKK